MEHYYGAYRVCAPVALEFSKRLNELRTSPYFVYLGFVWQGH